MFALFGLAIYLTLFGGAAEAVEHIYKACTCIYRTISDAVAVFDLSVSSVFAYVSDLPGNGREQKYLTSTARYES